MVCPVSTYVWDKHSPSLLRLHLDCVCRNIRTLMRANVWGAISYQLPRLSCLPRSHPPSPPSWSPSPWYRCRSYSVSEEGVHSHITYMYIKIDENNATKRVHTTLRTRGPVLCAFLLSVSQHRLQPQKVFFRGRIKPRLERMEVERVGSEAEEECVDVVQLHLAVWRWRPLQIPLKFV